SAARSAGGSGGLERPVTEAQALELKDRESWLEARRGLITASDAASAMGLNPYKSPLKLYAQKLGRLEGEEENEAMAWGRLFQSGIGERFAEKTGRAVTEAPQHTIYLHPDAPFVGGTFDFFQKDATKGDGILETKASQIPWQDEPPVMYQVQLQCQLSISGRPYGSLAKFESLRRPPLWSDQERNEKFIK